MALNTLRPLPERVETMIVETSETASWAVRKLIDRTQEDLKVFGLDCEWDLVTKKGVVHKPDILQIATVHGFCAIFRLHLLKTVPPELKGFLEDPYFAKVGVGVLDDSVKLKQSYDVTTEGTFDVRHLADVLGIPPKGLATLSKSVLGVNLAKYNYTFHQWTGRLSKIQTEYAALDAVYSARLFYKMSHDRLTQLYGNDWQNWTNREYHEKTLALWDKYVNKNFDFPKSSFYYKNYIEFMLTFCDLTPAWRNKDEKINWKGADERATEGYTSTTERGAPPTPHEGERTEPQTPPEEITKTEEEPQTEAFPGFQARFVRKERKMARKKEKAKRVPMRYVKKFIKRVESQGMDPMKIPTEILPFKVLDESGKLDMNKIREL